MKPITFALLGIILSTGGLRAETADSSRSAPPRLAPVDPSMLPPALRGTNLDHLSSGALMLLNRNGNLVAPPAAWLAQSSGQTSAAEQAPVALDLRVGLNTRLGDDPAALPSTMRAQAEPHITRSQTNPDFVVATFQEGRFTNGGAVDCGYAVTRDGGLSWTRALIPELTRAVGGPYFRATDPVAGIDLNGNVFLNTDAATDVNFDSGVIVVSRSTDGAKTFAAPVIAFQAGSNVFLDKNWMAINTFSNLRTTNRVVVTFTEFFNNGPNPIARVYSDDAGQTWSDAVLIHPFNTSAQGSQPVFLPNGNLAIVYWNFGNSTSPGERVEVVLSTDGGETFGAPKRIANAIEYSEPNIRSGGFLPSATTDRTTGNLYVVYQSKVSNLPVILFTKSVDGGNTWSSPISISDDPGHTGVFNPAIAASPDGQKLSVAFYGHRDNPTSNTLIDMYLAQSFDGGATWQHPNVRLTTVSTDASLAPLTTSGYMLGDYLGIAESTTANVPAIPVWVDTRTGDPDPFITRIGVSPQVDFTSWQAARLSLVQINNPASGGLHGDADGDRSDNSAEFQANTNPNDAYGTARSLNISTRALVGIDQNVMIGGFIINGDAGSTKRVLIRALGPSLTQFGVPGALQDPTVELPTSSGTIFNDNWMDSPQAAEIQQTGFAPTDSRESAILQTLPVGNYTAIVRGKDGTSGIGLVEVYELDQTGTPKLNNISTRGFVGLDANVMIGGFIVGGGAGASGAGNASFVFRAIGPSLSAAGITSPLPDPTLELHDPNGTTIAADDNWKDTQQAELQLRGLAPTDDREAALLANLPQGNYTAIVRGKAGMTGVALVEVYNVP